MEESGISKRVSCVREGSRTVLTIECENCKKVFRETALFNRPNTDKGVFMTLAATLFGFAARIATEKLRKNLNRCTFCGKWVCDDCFVIPPQGDGLCACCASSGGTGNTPPRTILDTANATNIERE